MNKIAMYEALLEDHPLWVSEEDLMKTASAEDIEIYDLMCKVASEGTEEEIYALLLEATELGLDKEAGLMARGMGFLGRALGRAGAATGSKTLSQAGARASSRAAGMAGSSAGRASRNLIRAEEGLRGGGLRATQNLQRAQQVQRQAAGQAGNLARQAASQTGLRAGVRSRLSALGQRLSAPSAREQRWAAIAAGA